MLSVIIPSRNIPSWPFTQRTIDDLFNKATGEIEVICVLDGYLLNPPLKERRNLTVIHNVESKGMRPAINMAADIAKGKFICKCDDHVAFGEGYDEILAADCEDNWLVVPSRYSLNGDAFLAGEEKIKKYGPIDYLYLTYPFLKEEQFGWGLHGKKWYGEHGVTGGYFDREKKLKNILIDDLLTCQGSCWFMQREYFYKIGKMQQEGYHDHQEAQEMVFKVWLSGGRCVVNKKTWYAHLHKSEGRGYHLFRHHVIDSQIYSTDLWMNNKWNGQIKPLKSLIENPSWWPLELWPEDWDNPERWKNYDYKTWYNRGTA
jgi:glycosyltransferase involved in cell wall biosynthesis